MDRKTSSKIVLITAKTRLQNLVVRYNTVEQAKFVIEHSGNDFSDYLNEDTRYQQSVEYLCSVLGQIGSLHVVDRDFLPNYLFGKQDIVVAVGRDGLVANTLKYLDGQPLIGINPDPQRWDGVLLPFREMDVKNIVTDVIGNRRQLKPITLAQVNLNDGQKLYAVNDLFIGQRTHVSAMYELNYNGRIENQSSSGIIISTGLGSTGWFKSILAGASGIVNECRHSNIHLKQNDNFMWESDYLYYTVREPFPSRWTSADLVFGKIDNTHQFRISSRMPENGVIFSDGIEDDYLEFNSGVKAEISVADKKGMLVV